MLLLCIAFVHKSDFLRNCCISCLLNTSWLLQSRVLKNPSQSLRKSFRTSTILKVSQECVCRGDTQPSFCRRRHFGGSWYWVGSGNPVMRGLDFILFFFSYFVFSPAQQLVGSSCHGPQGPIQRMGNESFLLSLQTKNWGLFEIHGAWDTAGGTEEQTTEQSGEATCAHVPTRERRGRVPVYSSGLCFHAQKLFSFFYASSCVPNV